MDPQAPEVVTQKHLSILPGEQAWFLLALTRRTLRGLHRSSVLLSHVATLTIQAWLE